jgi:hypothetical protein
MPHWCNNFVTFSGEEENVKQVLAMFKTLAERQGNEGDKPDWMKEHEHYMFDITVDEEGQVNYQTRWSESTSDILQISKYYNVSAEYSYEEPGSDVYGTFFYKAGDEEGVDICLESEDYDLYEECEDGNGCMYKGKWWESEAEVLDDILEKKIEAYRAAFNGSGQETTA